MFISLSLNMAGRLYKNPTPPSQQRDFLFSSAHKKSYLFSKFLSLNLFETVASGLPHRKSRQKKNIIITSINAPLKLKSAASFGCYAQRSLRISRIDQTIITSQRKDGFSSQALGRDAGRPRPRLRPRRAPQARLLLGRAVLRRRPPPRSSSSYSRLAGGHPQHHHRQDRPGSPEVRLPRPGVGPEHPPHSFDAWDTGWETEEKTADRGIGRRST